MLDCAAGILQASVTDTWSCGRCLERLVHKTVNPGRLATAHLLWRTPFSYGGAKAQIIHELGSKPTGTTVFGRHGLLNPEKGEPWRLATHQPRHLLNTLAQSKHLLETLIAFWSGRKRVDQNAWYNHIPHEAFIEAYVTMGKNAPREIGVVDPLADKVEERARREMVTHDTALRLEVGSIISTRYGLCRHNYALTPCPKDKNCIGCGENAFIKGDARQIAEGRVAGYVEIA